MQSNMRLSLPDCSEKQSLMLPAAPNRVAEQLCVYLPALSRDWNVQVKLLTANDVFPNGPESRDLWRAIISATGK